MSRQPSEILKAHGVRNPRSCIRELARHGYGFAPIAAAPDLPDLQAGEWVADPGREQGVLYDATRALIPHDVRTSTIDGADRELVGLLLTGRINQSDRVVTTLTILDADGAGVIVSHLTRFVGLLPGWAQGMAAAMKRAEASA